MDALDGTGVRNIDMPLLPDRVWQALQTGQDVSGVPPVRTDD
jgi:carbon-monoxide dehydrogenase large subunit